MNLSAPSLDLNEQFLRALHIMEQTDKNVFITGRAGTGKSTLLQHFRNTTKKNIAVLAPTGVAAVNVKGQTIHSFFNFKPDVTPDTVRGIRPKKKAVYKNLDAIVIDEVSMVRADLMDCMDGFLRIHGKSRSHPFGGIQMIFIGDLYQLPPVVKSHDKAVFKSFYSSPYFFDAMLFNNGFEMQFIELDKVYRQRDDRFLSILNAIRNNTASEEDISALNARYMPDFHDDKGFYIYITTTNDLADSINARRLADLKEKEYRYHGLIEGDFNARDLPTGLEITLKKGAQVMLLNNDSEGRWINGSIGRVIGIEKLKDEPDIIMVKLEHGETVEVGPYTWGVYEFYYDKITKRVISETAGTFTQYPLRLAWALTIHKCQGMTFDRVVIDIGRGIFSHGQLYVALSRCTTLEGIVLKKQIAKRQIFMDWRVVEFVTKYQYIQAEKALPAGRKITIIRDAIKAKKEMEIVYLKTKDEKSRRKIMPSFVGELEYNGRRFQGVRAFCSNRREDRVFHLDRILEMRVVD